MNFKKRVNGSWADIPHYIHNTSTDTITTLPADIYANAATATVGLKGNMSQTGTPTPDNPIMPQETGERTGNLFDEDYTGISSSLKYVPVYVGNGSFTLSTTCPIIEGAATLFFLAGNVQSGASSVSNGVYKNRPITVASSNGYVTVVYRYVSYATGSCDPRNEKTMLNTGSTALPYEPYGYKIPISSASTTTPVYLGEVESTRRINKLVLTGEENITSSHTDIGLYNIPVTDYLKIVDTTTNVCSHYKASINVNGWSDVTDMSCRFYGNMSSPSKLLYIRDSSYTSIADFKAYLAQQYAAGTPVTIWYILTEPETGIVNEPLRKIGEYADEVSNISIPVTTGGDTISVGTTLQPSEVTVNYKGWHPVQSAHERDNGAWT